MSSSGRIRNCAVFNITKNGRQVQNFLFNIGDATRDESARWRGFIRRMWRVL